MRWITGSITASSGSNIVTIARLSEALEFGIEKSRKTASESSPKTRITLRCVLSTLVFYHVQQELLPARIVQQVIPGRLKILLVESANNADSTSSYKNHKPTSNQTSTKRHPMLSDIYERQPQSHPGP